MPEVWDKERPDATDRCETCHGQAYVVTRVNGSLLKWCGHHWRKYEVKLDAVAEMVWNYLFLLEDEVKQ